MGYPNFGNVKTIVLPIPTESIGVDEYKEKFGIDLRKLLKLHTENGSISLETDALVLIRDMNGTLRTEGSTDDGYSFYGSIFPAVCVSKQLYVERENIAALAIGGINGTEKAVFGITFSIQSDVEFTMDNLKVAAAIN